MFGIARSRLNRIPRIRIKNNFESSEADIFLKIGKIFIGFRGNPINLIGLKLQIYLDYLKKNPIFFGRNTFNIKIAI